MTTVDAIQYNASLTCINPLYNSNWLSNFENLLKLISLHFNRDRNFIKRMQNGISVFVYALYFALTLMKLAFENSTHISRLDFKILVISDRFH
jgi:hypothetical protein